MENAQRDSDQMGWRPRRTGGGRKNPRRRLAAVQPNQARDHLEMKELVIMLVRSDFPNMTEA